MAVLLAKRSSFRGQDPKEVLKEYLRAAYARDYREAYRFIASEDRRVKDEETYAKERGTFSGFTLEAAKKLAGFIEATPVEEKTDGARARLKLKFRLPDANKLSTELLDWDEERLNNLSPNEQRDLIEQLDRRGKEGKVSMIDGEQEFTLVKESGGWRISLDWAEGVHISFDTVMPRSLAVEAKPLQKEVIVRAGEPFNISFKVRNLSNREVSTRIAHHVEPKESAQFLELVQCSLILPVTLSAGKEEEYSSAYLLHGDVPEGLRRFKVTYEFKVEE